MTDREKFNLSLLIPPARARAEGIIVRLQQRGFKPYVGSTLRTLVEQKEAVRRGTTSRKQNLSWHLIKRAWDLRDTLPGGGPDPTTQNERLFLATWEECEAAGVRSLAFERDKSGHPRKKLINGGKLWDAGHCEYREPYKTLVDAIRAEAPELLEEHTHDDPDDAIPEFVLPPGLPPSPFA